MTGSSPHAEPFSPADDLFDALALPVPWLAPGVNGIQRARRWDAVRVVDLPALEGWPGDELELHVYGNGRHPGDSLPDGTRMSGGLTERRGIPMGTWQHRFIDWFRDLGFLQKPGVETKAARDVAAFASRR